MDSNNLNPTAPQASTPEPTTAPVIPTTPAPITAGPAPVPVATEPAPTPVAATPTATPVTPAPIIPGQTPAPAAPGQTPTIPVIPAKNHNAGFGKALIFLAAITIVAFGLAIIGESLFKKGGIDDIIGSWDCGTEYILGSPYEYSVKIKEDEVNVTREAKYENYAVYSDIDIEFYKKSGIGNTKEYAVKVSKAKTYDSEGVSRTATAPDGAGIIFVLDDDELSFSIDNTELTCKKTR